nr:hypothetical protein BaRGS_018906 [Batillaria attramentaria]
MSCLWDADYSYMQTAFMMCEMMCGYTPRCWGYMSGNFQPTPDGRSFVIVDNTGCTMIMADAASTCRHIKQTYFVQFSNTVRYEFNLWSAVPVCLLHHQSSAGLVEKFQPSPSRGGSIREADDTSVIGQAWYTGYKFMN